MKQAAIEFVGYSSKVASEINHYLHRNPTHRIISTTSSVAGANGQISLIAIIEGDETVKAATTLRDEPYFTQSPFAKK